MLSSVESVVVAMYILLGNNKECVCFAECVEGGKLHFDSIILTITNYTNI